MLSSRSCSLNRRKRQSGNAILEGTIVILPLLFFIMFICEIGLAMFIRVTLQHAVREGVRYAITWQTETSSGGRGLNQDQSITDVVILNSLNFLRTSNITIAYYDGQITPTNPVPSLNLVPAPGGNVPGNVVEVTANYDHTFATSIFGNTPMHFRVSSADRMESGPLGQPLPTR